MSLTKIFGSNLRHHRKARQLIQADLAELVGISTEMISKIERGVSAPSFDTVERIADALGLPPLTLFGAGADATPKGERGRLLRRINATLASLNDADLARAARFLDVFTAS